VSGAEAMLGHPGRPRPRQVRVLWRLLQAAVRANRGEPAAARLSQRGLRVLRVLWAASRDTLPRELRGGVDGDGDEWVPRLDEGTAPVSLVGGNIGVGTGPGGATPSMTEDSRRSQIRGVRLRASVWANGQRLWVSDPTPVQWPSFTAEFGGRVGLRLVRRPGLLEVRVDQLGTLWHRPVARVRVPVPGAGAEEGVPAAALPVVEGAFSFAGERPLALQQFVDGIDPPPRAPLAASANSDGGITDAPSSAQAGRRVERDTLDPGMLVERRTRGTIDVWAGWTAGLVPARALVLA